jgi:radical SAM superfamily enzyme YgiQ (UPF0313 family)
MKIVLTSLCASYSHTPLALYALKARCAEWADSISVGTFTIHQPDDYILRCLYTHKPDIIGFSCYIWNIEKTRRIASSVRLILPGVLIIFGGPEMAAEYESDIESGIADIVVPGEGEEPLAALLQGKNPADIQGMACRDKLSLPDISKESTLNIPFPYPDNLNEFNNKALYYEASRGCPFSCGYCLAGGQPLRLKPSETVFKELSVFIRARVKRVKFTDRTFNAQENFAMAIWRYLMETDNGVTNFHFEMAADLLSDEALALLSQARAGLFQFEIGVQSACPAALRAVNRKTDIERLFNNTARLRSNDNIHIHLGLIAGLPEETPGTFADGFNKVYGLNPHYLQVGFLKLLKGTPLRESAGKMGLVYSPHPPYEILSTPAMTHQDLLTIKSAAEMVKVFYNSGKCAHTLAYLEKSFPAAFDMYAALAEYWHRHGYHHAPHGKARVYKAMLGFIMEQMAPDAVDAVSAAGNVTAVKDLLRADFLSGGHEKSVPDWLQNP